MTKRLAIALLLSCGVFAHAQTEFKAGVTHRVFHPAAQRNWRGAEHKELRVTIWYPVAAKAAETQQFIGAPDAPLFLTGMAAAEAPLVESPMKRPLIVLSHGTGGAALQMAWLGTELARAGYIAAAVDHPGNNATEPYTAEGFALWWERASDQSEVIDGMLADTEFGAHIDAKRIGAAGFSIGGYTVLALGGAETDFSRLPEYCNQPGHEKTCQVPEMKSVGAWQDMVKQVHKTSAISLAESAQSFRDERVKAVFAIAPLGFVFTQDSLKAMHLPVEIVAGAADPIVLPRDNADYLRANIHGAREVVLPGGVVHYTFLDTCAAAGKMRLGELCADAAGVDRDAIHKQTSDMAIGFFDKALKVQWQ